MSGPPAALLRSLVDGPGAVDAVDWHDEIDSTMAEAARLAAAGAPEVRVVLADVQTAGRGRLGRPWQAPPGTSLMLSLLLRPGLPPAALPTLPLLLGSVLAEVVAAHLADGPEVALKWPNDLLVGGRKAAGVLAEAAGGAVIAGIGCNVDWRGVARPPELAEATSLAEAAGAGVDRWRLLAGLLGVFDRRYADWRADPRGVVEDYRPRCATIGRRVRVERVGSAPLEGEAVGVADDGALRVLADGEEHAIASGDVAHLRPT